MSQVQISEITFFLQGMPEDMLIDLTVNFDSRGVPEVHVYAEDPAKFRAAFRGAGVRGRWAKSYSGDYVSYKLTTSAGSRLSISTARGNVCKLIETGETETVTVPDYSQVPSKTIERPVTRWDCK